MHSMYSAGMLVRYQSVKYTNFHENPAKDSLIVPRWHTDMTMLIVSSRDFTNAPNKCSGVWTADCVTS